jgi:hypothetical protein
MGFALKFSGIKVKFLKYAGSRFRVHGWKCMNIRLDHRGWKAAPTKLQNCDLVEATFFIRRRNRIKHKPGRRACES